jgi:hypothetical protein
MKSVSVPFFLPMMKKGMALELIVLTTVIYEFFIKKSPISNGMSSI